MNSSRRTSSIKPNKNVWLLAGAGAAGAAVLGVAIYLLVRAHSRKPRSPSPSANPSSPSAPSPSTPSSPSSPSGGYPPAKSVKYQYALSSQGGFCTSPCQTSAANGGNGTTCSAWTDASKTTPNLGTSIVIDGAEIVQVQSGTAAPQIFINGQHDILLEKMFSTAPSNQVTVVGALAMVLSAANAQGQSSHQGVVIPCASDSDAIAGLATMAGQWAQRTLAQLASGGFNSPAKISFAIGGDCSDLWNHPIFLQAFPTLASFTLDANYPAVGAFYLEPNDAYDGGQGLGGSGDAINCLISDSFTF